MQFTSVLSNFSLLTSSLSGISHLRSYILTEAVSGSFSKTKPDSWKKTTLGAEVDIIRGITFPSSAKHREPSEDRIVCLRTTNVQDLVDWVDLLYVPESYVKNDNQYIRMNDILISMANSRELVGKVSLVTRDDIRCTLGGFIAAIRCSKTILPEFLMILLRVPATKEKIIDSSTQTTNIANISLGRLRPLEINLPTIQEQLNIVNKVSQLFNRCDQLETSLSDVQTLSKSTRRSVVDGVSTAQTPQELQIAWERIQNNWEVITGTTEAVDAVRTLILDLAVRGQIAPHDLSGLPAEELIKESIQMANRKRSRQSRDNQGAPFEIPKHWVWSTIEDLCETQTGTTPKIQDSDNLQELIHYVTAADMVKLKAVKNRSVPMSAAKRGGRIAPKDSVLFVGIGATIGKCCLISSPATFNQQIHAATPRNINAQYLCLVLASGYFQKICKERTNATAIPILNKSKWETINIPVPPLNEQKKIAETVSKLFNLCDELESLLTIKSSIAEKFSRSVVSASA